MSLFNSLDFISEQKIIKNIKKNFPEMTIILISHRSQSLEICDKLIELN